MAKSVSNNRPDAEMAAAVNRAVIHTSELMQEILRKERHASLCEKNEVQAENRRLKKLVRQCEKNKVQAENRRLKKLVRQMETRLAEMDVRARKSSEIAGYATERKIAYVLSCALAINDLFESWGLDAPE